MKSTKHGKLFEVRSVMTFFFTLMTGIEVIAWEAAVTSVTDTTIVDTSTHALPEARCLLMVRGEALLLLPDEFKISSCAVCYKYIPPDPSQPANRTRWNLTLRSKMNIGILGYRLRSPNKTVVEAHAEETLGPEEMLTHRERDKWRECCTAAKRSCREKLINQSSTTRGMCPSVWDGWSFWSETPAGQLVYGSCPSYIMYSSNSCTESSQRECRSNGTWSPVSDYATCVTYEYRARRQSIVVLVGEYAVSIAFLVPALAIFFLLYRQLLGHRITLHRNLFVSLLLHAGTQVLYQVTVVLPNMKSVSETGTSQDGEGCIYLNVATKYFRCSSFMWMFCEGYYLHRVLAAAFSPDGSPIVFYFIGWGLPMLPTSLYTGLRTSEGLNSCWTGYSDFEWVLFVPNIISLVANLVFLVSILRVLTQLKQPIEHEPSHYRRAVRATLVLVPLLGLHFVLTLFRPKQCALQRAHEHVDHVLDGLQGALVACLFCFFNGEVHELLRRARRTLVDRYQPGLRPSRGSHSFSTAQATLVTPAQAPHVI